MIYKSKLYYLDLRSKFVRFMIQLLVMKQGERINNLYENYFINKDEYLNYLKLLKDNVESFMDVFTLNILKKEEALLYKEWNFDMSFKELFINFENFENRMYGIYEYNNNIYLYNKRRFIHKVDKNLNFILLSNNAKLFFNTKSKTFLNNLENLFNSFYYFEKKYENLSNSNIILFKEGLCHYLGILEIILVLKHYNKKVNKAEIINNNNNIVNIYSKELLEMHSGKEIINNILDLVEIYEYNGHKNNIIIGSHIY